MNLMFVDSHAHLFDTKLNENLIDLNNISNVVVPSYSMDNLDLSVNYCLQHDKCHCALGIHPEYIDDYDLETLQRKIESNKHLVCAIGEIGLDENYPTQFESQINVFVSQLNLARKFNLPAIIHLRSPKAFQSFFEIIKDYQDVKFILHCFCGNENDLFKANQNDCYISFATNITYRGNIALRNLVQFVPQNRLLIETDSPNMRPAQIGGRGINYPQNIIYTAQTISNILNMPIEKIAKITSNNAKNAFNLIKN